MGSSSMKLGAMDDDITSGLLADITVTMVTLAVEHGQMTFLGYIVMSQNRTIMSGLQLTSLLEQ